MNIPDEYFTDEVPTDPGFDYLVKWPRSGAVTYMPGQRAVGCVPVDPPLRFYRLAPAADSHKLKELVNALRSDVVTFGKMGARLKAENEKLRGWVKDAYEEGYIDGDSTRITGEWVSSRAKARLEGRSE